MPSSVFYPPLSQALRLDVDVPPSPGAPLLNLLRNHSGTLGGFQWISPLVFSSVRRSTAAQHTQGVYPVVLCYFGQANVNYSDNPNGQNYCLTEPLRVKPGTFVGTSFVAPWCANRYRATIVYYDAAKKYFASAVASPIYAQNSAGPQFYNDENPVPPNAYYAALVFDLVTSSGAPYRRPSSDTDTSVLSLAQVMIKNAPTKAAAQAPVFNSEDANWVNVIGPTHEITIDRSEADLGTLRATVLDATLDPALNGTFRAGRRCRLITAAGEPIFTGKVRDIDVDYDLTRTDGRGTRVKIEAVDNWAQLAANPCVKTPLPGGGADIFEGSGVPWLIDGNDAHNAAGGLARAQIPTATSADQLHLYRDSDRAYATLNRAGVAVVRVNVAAPIVGLLTEADYSSLTVGTGIDRVINCIWFRILSIDSNGETAEAMIGPYIDGPSFDDWGPRTAEFTIAGAWTYPELKAYADAVFATNAQPTVAATRVRVPIRNNADIVRKKALIDLDDQVGPTNVAKGLNVYRRVVGVTHTITSEDGAGRWLVDVDLDANTSRPVPTSAPNL